MIRARLTEEVPDDVGWCPICRFHVERGHHCGEEVTSAPAAVAAPPYDADRDGPF